MTTDETTVDRPSALSGKADFTRLYSRPDPRELFRTLVPLDYQVPQHVLPVVEEVLARSGGRTVLDVCCSYGVNAALLRHDLDLAELMQWSGAPERQALSVVADIEQDRAMLAGRRRSEVRVLGLDTSQPAIDYARSAGLLADGWSEDLEARDPSDRLAHGIAQVDVILCTGGVGYIGPATFDRLLLANERPAHAWVVASVLRGVDYEPIADVLSSYGLQTRKVPGGPVRQRRFVSEAEERSAIAQVAATGQDVAGLEASGWFYADVYVSGPDDVQTDLLLNLGSR